jgi:predicted ribosome quality control (RQC) complex YloA/Tae2 family protein
MHFDALTLACVAAELQRDLCRGRIQQVLLVDAHAIGFEVYTPGVRHQLLLALQPGTARVHTVSYKLRRGVERDSPLLLLLRKYARGALIVAIEQPDPTERVLRFALEHPEHSATTLIVELIGRQPNAILLNPTGRILECLHRLSAGDAGRSVLPGQRYVAPPALAKLPPFDNGDDDYYARLAQIVAQPGPLWKALVAGIAGLSPTAAREIAWRAQNATDTDDGANVLAVARALQELWAPLHGGGWKPGTIEEEGSVVGFAAYPVHFRGRFVEQPSMGAALERFYAEANAARANDAYAVQRGQVLAQLKRALAQLERRLAALDGDEPPPGAAEALRTQANWLLALGGQIAPGETTLVVDLGNETLHIALDPLLSPVEQAQRMFKRAAKLARAAEIIPQRRAELLADRELLEQLTLDAQRAANQPELAAVLDELRNAGFLREARQRTPRVKGAGGGPLRFRTVRGVEIIVGRNARQNEQVTFKLARPHDLWLHVRGAPGSHVLLRAPDPPPDERDVLAAAQLAAYHSSLRGERRVDVIVTERRWVSHAPGGRIGQVIVTRERVVSVMAEMPEEVEEKSGEV